MNWTRFQVQSIEVAIALARLVLPTPGTSSMTRWPSASRHITASSIACCLPCTHLGDVGRDRVEQRGEAGVAGRRAVPGRPGAWLGAAFTAARVDRRCHDRRSASGRRRASATVGRRCRGAALPPPAAETAASAVYLAIDVGHDRLAAGIVNDYGEVLVRDRVATPARDVWPALQRLIRRVVAARPEDAGALLACGVTCEGPIDKDDGTVSPLHMPSLARLHAARAGPRADPAADRAGDVGAGAGAGRAVDRRGARRRPT